MQNAYPRSRASPWDSLPDSKLSKVFKWSVNVILSVLVYTTWKHLTSKHWPPAWFYRWTPSWFLSTKLRLIKFIFNIGNLTLYSWTITVYPFRPTFRPPSPTITLLSSPCYSLFSIPVNMYLFLQLNSPLTTLLHVFLLFYYRLFNPSWCLFGPLPARDVKRKKNLFWAQNICFNE